jgi:hypothetical protein
MRKLETALCSIPLAIAALAGCSPAETGSTVSDAPPPAAGEADSGRGDVAGLTLPRQGERFTIGEEQWEVVAATVSLPSEGVQQDTQIVDVTIQARRAGAEPIEYLGQDERREPDAAPLADDRDAAPGDDR